MGRVLIRDKARLALLLLLLAALAQQPLNALTHSLLPDMEQRPALYYAAVIVEELLLYGLPAALLLRGASFDWKQVTSERRNIAKTTVLRLVIFPAVRLTAGAIIGYRGVEFVTLIPLFASPTAVNTFNMDQEMGADLNIASGAIAISTALSFVTLFIWVSLFKHLGMF